MCALALGVLANTLANPSLGTIGPVDCPRAEGRLARSTGLLVENHPDYFAPLAIINRFDLTPRNLTTCGEYRILYAKQSGRTRPDDRLFLTATRFDADSIITIDDKLEATPNHPFYTARGLQRAEALELGDTLYAVDGAGAPLTATRIHSLVRRSASLVTHNIEVATHHNYFAGGFLVHDKP